MASQGLFLAAAMNLPTNDAAKLMLLNLTTPGRLIPVQLGARGEHRPLPAALRPFSARDRLF